MWLAVSLHPASSQQVCGRCSSRAVRAKLLARWRGWVHGVAGRVAVCRRFMFRSELLSNVSSHASYACMLSRQSWELVLARFKKAYMRMLRAGSKQP